MQANLMLPAQDTYCNVFSFNKRSDDTSGACSNICCTCAQQIDIERARRDRSTPMRLSDHQISWAVHSPFAPYMRSWLRDRVDAAPIQTCSPILRTSRWGRAHSRSLIWTAVSPSHCTGRHQAVLLQLVSNPSVSSALQTPAQGSWLCIRRVADMLRGHEAEHGAGSTIEQRHARM